MNFNELRNRSQRPENRWQGTLLSLDPGHTTGYAVWCTNAEEVFLVEAGQLATWEGDDLYLGSFEDLLVRHRPNHTVMETYQVYEWKSKTHSWSQVPTIQVIGGIKIICQQHKVSYSNQTAQVAKQFCTDEKLETWDFYKPGLRHARDAIRHGCYYLLFGNKK